MISTAFKFISKLIYILPKQFELTSNGTILLIKSDQYLNPFNISSKRIVDRFNFSNSSMAYSYGMITLNYYWFHQYTTYVSIEDRTKSLKRFLREYGYIKI